MALVDELWEAAKIKSLDLARVREILDTNPALMNAIHPQHQCGFVSFFISLHGRSKMTPTTFELITFMARHPVLDLKALESCKRPFITEISDCRRPDVLALFIHHDDIIYTKRPRELAISVLAKELQSDQAMLASIEKEAAPNPEKLNRYRNYVASRGTMLQMMLRKTEEVAVKEDDIALIIAMRDAGYMPEIMKISDSEFEAITATRKLPFIDHLRSAQKAAIEIAKLDKLQDTYYRTQLANYQAGTRSTGEAIERMGVFATRGATPVAAAPKKEKSCSIL